MQASSNNFFRPCRGWNPIRGGFPGFHPGLFSSRLSGAENGPQNINQSIMKTSFLAVASFLVVAGGAIAADADGIKAANLKDADLSLMKNHDPAVERENFVLLPGYEVNLFAAEPMLANPIHMVWDSRGRLWVACSWAYPQLKPGDVANDKIIILEDTDGDGSADKSTVFADGLYMPTGIELANGGCYVAQTPDVFFLKDTDGDDVADVRELALTGFGIEDSHHSISAWRRGPGGWIYFQEGIFLHAQVETQHGMVRNFNGGVYQYNPRTQDLRVFCRGTGGNPWGHVFDRWGQSFMVNNPKIMYLTPGTGNGNEKYPISPLISTEKQCGGDLASGRHLPEEIRGQLLTGRFKSRAVIRYEFIEDGAGYSANVLSPLIASKHPNFRPVDTKIGPDGAVYVADWYNSIINHAQHDFRDPRRDHDHGRVWRITAKNRPLVEKPKLAGVSIPELLDHLKSPEAWTRHQARLELSAKDRDEVVAALENWVKNLKPNDPDHDHHLVEAMWACQNVERVSESILKRVMAAKDGHARSAGARVIRYWHEELSDPVAIIAKAAGDSFPRTRMEAVLSAGYLYKAEAFTAALHALDHERDKFIDAALPQTVAALEPYWRPLLESGGLKFAKPDHRDFAERLAGIGFGKRLESFLKNPNPDSAEIADVKAQFVSGATSQQVRTVLKALGRRKGSLSRDATVAMLDSLQGVGRRGGMDMSRHAASLRPYLDHDDDAIAAGAAANLGVWKVAKAGPYLTKILRDDARTSAVRRAAAGGLAGLGRTEFVNELKSLAAEGDIESRYHAVTGLVAADLDDATAAVGNLLAEDPGNADPVALVSAFLKLRKGGAALGKALDGVTIHPEVTGRVAAYHRRTGQLPKNLTPFFQTTPEGSLSVALLKEKRAALTADVEKLGDPARGEMIYRRPAMACTSCHAIGPVGPPIGPNLVAVGAAAPSEYMVESILEPNKAIAEHYENMLFTLDDGSARMGVITFKSDKEVVIRDSAQAGAEVKILAADILKQQAMPSLMPAGLADQLQSRQEFLDLAKFLSVLGRSGPYANDESPVIRKWRVAAAADADSIPADDAAWLPAYSMVSGALPASDMEIGDRVFVRGFVNMQMPGTVQLMLNKSKGLKLWVDGEEIPDPAAPLDLSKGRRTFTFQIDRSLRGGAGLRVELATPAGSPAKFQPEGGI